MGADRATSSFAAKLIAMTDADTMDPRDREYMDSEADPEKREAIRCAVTTYRVEDRLAVGDACPQVRAFDLAEAWTSVSFDQRPSLLIFGSYT